MEIISYKPINSGLMMMTSFNGESYFALLMVLRATLNRSLLTIYSPEKELIYQELTGRIREIQPVKRDNRSFLITGDERNPQYIYSWK